VQCAGNSIVRTAGAQAEKNITPTAVNILPSIMLQRNNSHLVDTNNLFHKFFGNRPFTKRLERRIRAKSKEFLCLLSKDFLLYINDLKIVPNLSAT
jgi:hypothetical protein